MNVNITARKTVARDAFKERAERKLSKLDRFFEKDTIAHLTVTNEHERETVEVTISYNGVVFRAEKTTSDRLDSLDAVVDVLFRQIVKNKTKLDKKLKLPPIDSSEQDGVDVEPDDFNVVRTKRFASKPMDLQEAILQMNLLGHEFYVFRNSASSEVNVVYKRKHGGYGLIDPNAQDD